MRGRYLSLRLSGISKKFEFFPSNVALSVSDDGMEQEMDASGKSQINAAVVQNILRGVTHYSWILLGALY